LSDDFSPAWAPGWLTAGSMIAGYRLEDRIGQSGMAVVYRAHDVRLNRRVALKLLAPALAADAGFRERFAGEALAAAAVEDPHIIPVFEAGEADGVLFIAMRYVGGGDVLSLVRRDGPLPLPRVAAVISPVAAALDAAHAAGLVHRDVKPANMLLDVRPGRPDHVYLSDFGLSKESLAASGLTGSGHFIGTLDYISPEQIEGRPVDGRADQYALACAAFELLAGEPPFGRDQGLAVIAAHLSAPPPPVSARRTGLWAGVDWVLARALAKAPSDRYATCGDFASALRAALGLPSYDAGSADGPPGRTPAQAEVTSAGPPAVTPGPPQSGPPGPGPGEPPEPVPQPVPGPLHGWAATVDAKQAAVQPREPESPAPGPEPEAVPPTAGNAAPPAVGGAAPSAAGGPVPPAVGGAAPLAVGGPVPLAAGAVLPAVGGAVPPAVGGPVPSAAGNAVPPAAGGAAPQAVGGPVPLAVGGAVLPAVGGAVPLAAGGAAPGEAAMAGPDQPSRWRSGWRISVIAAAGAALVAAAISAAVIGLGPAPASHRPTPIAPVAPIAGPATAYVVSFGAGTVTPIDVATGRAGTAIQPGNSPWTIAITPDGKTAYVAGYSGGVTPVNLATGRVGTPIPIGGGMDAIAITPDGRTAYVAHDDGVTPIDLATGRAGTLIPVNLGNNAKAIAITPDGKTAYAGNFVADTITPIDLATGRVGTPIQTGALAIAITPDGRTAYAAAGDLTPIDLATGTAGTPIQAGNGVWAVAITPDGKTAYVADFGNGSVTPVDLATGTAGTPIHVGGSPDAIAITPDGKTAYVGNWAGHTVTPIDLATGIAGTPIQVGQAPNEIVITP
jgi:YVTN family beta-propeller protein